MKKGCLSVIVLMLLAGDVALYGQQAGSQQAAKLDTQVQVQMGYLLYLPKNYDEKESWPLVLFLHGAGEIGC